MKSVSTVYSGASSKDSLGRIYARDVYVNGVVLLPGPSQRIYNHSPDGFNWGYRGSGPAQLALAILFDFTGDSRLSQSAHQRFKEDYVATWDDTFELKGDALKRWVVSWAKSNGYTEHDDDFFDTSGI